VSLREMETAPPPEIAPRGVERALQGGSVPILHRAHSPVPVHREARGTGHPGQESWGRGRGESTLDVKGCREEGDNRSECLHAGTCAFWPVRVLSSQGHRSPLTVLGGAPRRGAGAADTIHLRTAVDGGAAEGARWGQRVQDPPIMHRVLFLVSASSTTLKNTYSSGLGEPDPSFRCGRWRRRRWRLWAAVGRGTSRR